MILIAALTACGQNTDPPSTSGSATAAPTPTATVAADPKELLELAIDNTLDAPSKRLTGTADVTVSSKQFEVVFVGDEAKGNSLERDAASGLESSVEFVKVDGSLYILAGEPYWQWYVSLEDRVLVVGHWVRVAADNPNHSPLLILSDSAVPWEPVGELTVDESNSDNDTVGLVDSAGNRFTVSEGDTPYLLRVELTQDTEVGPGSVDIAFSDFGTVAETITAPTGEIVDLQ